MKLEAAISIAGKKHKLVTHDIALKLSDAGSASFVVQADQHPAGIVYFDAGYTIGEYYRVFIGYVEKAIEKSAKHWTIRCHEVSHALQLDTPISLRHCYLNDVLKDITGATSLELNSPILTKQVARFTSTGDGYYALRSIPRVFNISDFVWWQTKKGALWCGQWSASDYAQLGNLELDTALFTEQTPHSATLPLLPALRPGMLVNNKRIIFVRHKDHKTVLRWTN